MKNKIELDEDNYLFWELTPWDSAVFDRKTAQILEFKFESEKNAKILLERFESISQAKFTYGRFMSNDLTVKRVFFDRGYFNAETSLQIFLPNVQNYELPKMYKKRLKALEYISNSMLDSVSIIAHEMFDFSRFHEDPYIDQTLANLRIKNWVLDMRHQDVKTLANRDVNGKIRCFMIYKVEDNKTAQLILGGSVVGERMNAPYFWASVIDTLKNDGITKIKTTISAANSGVLSLYLNLGFGISATQTDYHKHI